MNLPLFAVFSTWEIPDNSPHLQVNQSLCLPLRFIVFSILWDRCVLFRRYFLLFDPWHGFLNTNRLNRAWRTRSGKTYTRAKWWLIGRHLETGLSAWYPSSHRAQVNIKKHILCRWMGQVVRWQSAVMQWNDSEMT